VASSPSVIVSFVADTTKLVQGVKQADSATGSLGEKIRKTDWKRVALFAGGAVAIGAGVKYLKSATDATMDLAKGTMAIQRVTKMDTTTASEWVAVLKTRGIETSTFTRSLTILSKQMEAAKGGNKTAIAAFQALGVSMADVRSGDTQKVLMEAANGFQKLGPGAQRAALTQQLFGRSSQQLTPLLYKGADAIQAQLDMAGKYGDALKGKSTKEVADFIDKQREMQFASDGVKVQLGTALLPILVQLATVLVELVRIFQPLIANTKVLKTLLAVFASLWAAYTVATGAATVATALFGTTLSTSIILATGGAVLAIAALIAIGVLLYKNWDKVAKAADVAWSWIKKSAMSVLDWLKRNWPLVIGILLGPIGTAAAAIYLNWSKITGYFTTAYNSIKGVVNNIKAKLNEITSWFSTNANTIKTWLTTIAGYFSRVWDAAKSMVSNVKQELAKISAWFANNAGAVKSHLSTLAGYFSAPYTAAKNMVANVKEELGKIATAITNVEQKVKNAATAVANAIKAPLNAVIGAWNSLAFTIPKVSLPSVNIPHVGKIGGQSFGGQSFPFPKIPKLAAGGVFDSATLAVVGEAGREIVTPESLLRQIVGELVPEVHVYIGDTELRNIVRVEANGLDNMTAAALLSGRA